MIALINTADTFGQFPAACRDLFPAGQDGQNMGTDVVDQTAKLLFRVGGCYDQKFRIIGKNGAVFVFVACVDGCTLCELSQTIGKAGRTVLVGGRRRQNSSIPAGIPAGREGPDTFLPASETELRFLKADAV